MSSKWLLILEQVLNGVPDEPTVWMVPHDISYTVHSCCLLYCSIGISLGMYKLLFTPTTRIVYTNNLSCLHQTIKLEMNSLQSLYIIIWAVLQISCNLTWPKSPALPPDSLSYCRQSSIITTQAPYSVSVKCFCGTSLVNTSILRKLKLLNINTQRILIVRYLCEHCIPVSL